MQVRQQADDGTCEVAVAGPAHVRPFRARGPSLPLGQAAALLMIRPTGIRLCASHTGEHHLAGTVADVAFRGRGYEHAIDIAGHGGLTNVFADTRAHRGEAVGLRLDAAGCHLFSAGSASAGPAGDQRRQRHRRAPRLTAITAAGQGLASEP